MRTAKLTVFLDRDGVINKKAPEGDYIKCPGELRLLPRAAQAIHILNELGCLVIVITNQRGISRRLMSEEDLVLTMEELKRRLARRKAYIDAWYFCPDVEEHSPCRNPNIGMFLQAKQDFPEIDFAHSFVVGDSWRDMEAARAIGAKSILILRGNEKDVRADVAVRNLFEAALLIRGRIANT